MKEIWLLVGVATLIPISTPNLSHDKGIFVGRNIYTNAPVYIDTFCGPPTLPNPHVFICGTSGGGKSVALKTLTARNIATTESTDENASNQAGIGANAVSLIELKPTIDYSINKIENDYGLQFYNSTIKLLQEYN